MLPELSLEGRVAIVTGASRGIGHAIALRLAEAGADIVATARTETDLEDTANEARKLGRKALAIPTDVTKSAEVDAMVEKTIDQFGKVDIMVNNAGQFRVQTLVPLPKLPFEHPQVVDADKRISDEVWKGMMDVNVNSVFYGCRAVGPHMIERRYGKIINISSISGKQAYPMFSLYNVGKTAIDMLTRILALEWADYNVCVNAIGPGHFHTMLNGEDCANNPDACTMYTENIPVHRGGDLRELGALAVYLASPASDYMTGQINYLDGGWTAR